VQSELNTRQVHDVAFSNAGDTILTASGNWQAKLFTRDGAETCVACLSLPQAFDVQHRAEYAKGDMYLRDMKNTACAYSDSLTVGRSSRHAADISPNSPAAHGTPKTPMSFSPPRTTAASGAYI
jgi:hypothetical protein